MKYGIWAILLFLGSGCFENQNSSTSDAGGLSINPSDSVEFIAAKTLFSSNCSGGSCHNDFSSKTEVEFIAEGLVVLGDPDSSSVFCRLRGSTGSCGSKNMPKNKPQLDSAELQIVSDWITGMTP